MTDPIRPGQETSGRYVIVQMDNGRDLLNLREVKAFGRWPVTSSGCIIEENINYRGNAILDGPPGGRRTVENQDACAKLSFSKSSSSFWTYQPSTKLCWLKTSKSGRMAQSGLVSGNDECGK